MLVNNGVIGRWYRAAFDLIQRYKRGDSTCSEKVYSAVYEWFTLLTFFFLKTAEPKAFRSLYEALLPTGKGEDEFKVIEGIRFVRSAEGEDEESKQTLIRPAQLQSCFVEYTVSESTMQTKEGEKTFETVSPSACGFLCKLLCGTTSALVSSYNVPDISKSAYLGAAFAADFRTILSLLQVLPPLRLTTTSRCSNHGSKRAANSTVRNSPRPDSWTVASV